MGLLPGWAMVSAESGRLLDRPDELAADLASVRHEGNGVYAITTRANDRFRLVKRVGALDPGVTASYASNGDTVELTLSDQLTNDEVAPALARALAESAAGLRGGRRYREDARLFGPHSVPDLDAEQIPVDAGNRAELRQRGRMEQQLDSRSRRAAMRAEIRKLALTMGVAEGQPNAELLRTLLTEEERAILDRGKGSGREPLDERVRPAGYVAKSLVGSGTAAVAVGVAAAAFTGNPLVGLGIAAPTIANAAAGALTERKLDRQRTDARRPAYKEDEKQRAFDYPGLRGNLDGAEPVRPDVVKLPRTTTWGNYFRRHLKPTLAAAAVAGALTPFGVPAWSTAMVIASSALAKSLAERLVDTKKMEFRLSRVDATERHRLADPQLYVNQLAAEFTDLQARLDRVVATAANAHVAPSSEDDRPPGRQAPAMPPSPQDLPSAPPFTVALSAQLIENVSGSARRIFVGGTPTAVDVDPTALARHVSVQAESLINAAGPGLLGAITGAIGDKHFLSRDEDARYSSRQWYLRHKQATQAEALAETLEPRLELFRSLTESLEEQVGLPVGAASQHLPVVTSRPTGPRPMAQAPKTAYVAQVAAGTLGGTAGALGLDLVLDLPDLAVVMTVAGGAGSTVAGPIARRVFRNHEIETHLALEDNKGVHAVDQAELNEQRAFSRYLSTQLTMQAEAFVRRTEPVRVTLSPPESSPLYADHVRAAVRRAELDNVPPGQPESRYDQDVRSQRTQALHRVEHWAAEIDRTRGEASWALDQAQRNTQHAIKLYESIADGNGRRLPFPDLRTVDPAAGRRVVGGPTDQVRAGAEQAVRRLVAEPAGKPLLPERLIALEQLTRAADAVDHHATHGTDESRAHVQQQFDKSLDEAHRLWREAGVRDGLSLPVLSVVSEPGGEAEHAETGELAHLRRMIGIPQGGLGPTNPSTAPRRAPAPGRPQDRSR
ncbi:hypothetical protein HPO96_20900 [Kribbella sandramycini]|uniref:Uncharacterized protein n=1 Tax=Kribbella sandramycini TaxID=60450 RepID=A0A7Y4P028_9ACTN|nr:hypothetical protein [Kribbella sandramycini]MBB6566638.1 hypothetical protein [Kribbella sandramycini]NOL42707.1 hypothetical protein [Kribbella sandramycini]